MKKFNLESQAGLAISKIKDTIPKIIILKKSIKSPIHIINKKIALNYINFMI